MHYHSTLARTEEGKLICAESPVLHWKNDINTGTKMRKKMQFVYALTVIQGEKYHWISHNQLSLCSNVYIITPIFIRGLFK
jgi:hypothetical protein